MNRNQTIFLVDTLIFGFAMLLGKLFSYRWLIFYFLLYLWVGVLVIKNEN
jgi:hypothetical protein